MVLPSPSPRATIAATALIAGALLATGCTSKKEEAARGRLENAQALIEEADSAGSRCGNAQAGDAVADQNVTTTAGKARVAQDLCRKSAALNQQASAAVNSAGVP